MDGWISQTAALAWCSWSAVLSIYQKWCKEEQWWTINKVIDGKGSLIHVESEGWPVWSNPSPSYCSSIVCVLLSLHLQKCPVCCQSQNPSICCTQWRIAASSVLVFTFNPLLVPQYFCSWHALVIYWKSKVYKLNKNGDSTVSCGATVLCITKPDRTEPILIYGAASHDLPQGFSFISCSFILSSSSVVFNAF